MSERRNACRGSGSPDPGNAVGERRPETIEVGAQDIHALIGDQARQVLPHALAHDARLAVIYAKALFVQNGGDGRGELYCAPLKCFAAGKRQIVAGGTLTWPLPCATDGNRARPKIVNSLGPSERMPIVLPEERVR